MKRTTIAVWIVCAIGAAAVAAGQPLRTANYNIAVSLDAQKKMLHGNETLTWTNTTRDAVRELRFHLYLNAFKNSQSTFIRESGGRLRGDRMEKDAWGWIDVNSIAANGKGAAITFVQPDDNNAADRTVAAVALPFSVQPGQSATVQIAFTAQLPKVFARSGYYDDFFLAGQWFPKIGVYEEGRGWNCHQYHANSEFFADFGTYTVAITTPQRFVVGATGVQQREVKNADGTKTVFYRAENVHDFAWTAYPGYVDLSERWRGVHIRLLIQPQHRDQASRFFEAAKAALEYSDLHIGPYPYSTLTLVDPANGASGADGMEYPTFITTGTLQFFGSWLKFPEMVTVHEFMHQYFYGLLATNEFEHPWMDEGMTQYLESRIMDDTYGAGSSVLSIVGFTMGDAEMSRSMYAMMRNPMISPLSAAAWQFPRGSYGSLVYGKTATVLMTLERMIGRPAMDSLLRAYYIRWRFRHPSPADFIAVANEVVPRVTKNKFGASLDWFFDQTLSGTGICDYELTALDVRNIESMTGIVEKNGTKVLAENKADSAAEIRYRSTVFVSRLGDIQLPVSVLVRFENGEEVRETWDGRSRSMEYRYERSSRAVWAGVDPEETLMIDINRINNARSSEPEHGAVWKYAVKFLFWAQQLFSWSLLAA
jgi:hypothetical protein